MNNLKTILEILGFKNSWEGIQYPLGEYRDETGTMVIRAGENFSAYYDSGSDPSQLLYLNFQPDVNLMITLLRKTFNMESKCWLYLDDIRTPKMGDWAIVRNYDTFITHIEKHGMPQLVSLDHDLGKEHTQFFFENGGFASPPDPQVEEFQEKTGFDCAKWMIEYCLDRNLSLPFVTVHSANPVGGDNIISLINNFKRYKNEEENCQRMKW